MMTGMLVDLTGLATRPTDLLIDLRFHVFLEPGFERSIHVPPCYTHRIQMVTVVSLTIHLIHFSLVLEQASSLVFLFCCMISMDCL